MIAGIYHVNVNVVDLDRSISFYEMIGFRLVKQLGEHQSKELALGLGVPGAHIRAALLRIGNEPRATYLDLVQWLSREHHRLESPHVANGPGIARLSLLTNDIASEYERLCADGVEFLSPPVSFNDQTRFCLFRDPDGVLLQLIERGPKSGHHSE